MIIKLLRINFYGNIVAIGSEVVGLSNVNDKYWFRTFEFGDSRTDDR